MECWGHGQGFDDKRLCPYRDLMPYEAPDLARLSLAEIAGLVAARKLPPVESWKPVETGDSEMRIAADGKWYHQGGEITRPAMIRAFSSLLRRETDGSHWLVTPQQKLSIIVEDAPFVAVELRNGLPYLHVRDGLWAKLARPVYYELAEIALAENPGAPRVWSNGVAFHVGEPI
jgi:uncharacterized protein